MVVVVVDITLKMVKDRQLGSYELQFYVMIISNHFFIAVGEIRQWLSAPDNSKNYNEARDKHQKDTCSWFLDGRWFHDLQEEAGILWIKGISKLSGKYLALLLVLNNYTAGCGKTILW